MQLHGKQLKDTSINLVKINGATGQTLTLSGTTKIQQAAAPTVGTDLVNKDYVDGVATGLDVKASVRAATTANITLSGAQTIDGVSVIAGDRVLVKNQTTASANGIYVAAAGAWARSADADNSPAGEVTSGMFTFVEEGTVNASTGWVLSTANPITLGTTSLSFVMFSAAGSYTGGNGITITGQSIAVNHDGDGLTFNGSQLSLELDGATLSKSATGLRISASYTGQTSITTLGTITTGVWNGTTIAVANGGTGATSLTANGILIGNGTSAVTATTLTNGQLLIGSTGAAPVAAALTGTTNRLTVTNGAGSITLDISSAYVGQATITTLGTITTGTWQGTAVGAQFGGTGQTTYATGDILYASASNVLSKLTIGGVPAWTTAAGDITDVVAGAGLTGGGTSGSVTLDVVAANTSIVVNANDIQAAVPQSTNKEMTANVTTADFQKATNTTVVAAPAAGSYVQVLVNGLSQVVGNGVKTKDCYFANDGTGTVAIAFSAITAGSELYWVGSVAGYELAATDKIDLMYVKA
jgi:hypothetical protein